MQNNHIITHTHWILQRERELISCASPNHSSHVYLHTRRRSVTVDDQIHRRPPPQCPPLVCSAPRMPVTLSPPVPATGSPIIHLPLFLTHPTSIGYLIRSPITCPRPTIFDAVWTGQLTSPPARTPLVGSSRYIQNIYMCMYIQFYVYCMHFCVYFSIFSFIYFWWNKIFFFFLGGTAKHKTLIFWV